MPNPSNKQELLAAMADSYAKLNEQIAKMSEEAISAPFDFAADPKKCGVRWQYDRSLRDLLIHLYEWQVLMREFVNNFREGHPRDYLPDEYRKNYHEMDKMLVEKHQNTPLEEAKRLLRETHEEMLRLAESFNEEELFTKGYYKNTYTTDMAAYFVSLRAGGEVVEDTSEKLQEITWAQLRHTNSTPSSCKTKTWMLPTWRCLSTSRHCSAKAVCRSTPLLTVCHTTDRLLRWARLASSSA